MQAPALLRRDVRGAGVLRVREMPFPAGYGEAAGRLAWAPLDCEAAELGAAVARAEAFERGRPRSRSPDRDAGTLAAAFARGGGRRAQAPAGRSWAWGGGQARAAEVALGPAREDAAGRRGL